MLLTMYRFSRLRYLAPFVVAVAMQAYLYSIGLHAVSQDESVRTILAYRIASGELSPSAQVWLPLHNYLTAAALWVHPDLFLTPRVLNGFTGLAVIAVIMLLAKALWGNRLTTISAGMLAATFSPLLVLSVTPLSEALAFLLVLCGLLALVSLERTGHPAYACLCGLALGTANAVRYEAWAISMLFGLYFLWRLARNKKRGPADWLSLIAIALLLCAVPAAWMFLWWWQKGHPIGFLGVSGARYFEVKNPERDFLLLAKQGTLVQFLLQNIYTLNIAGLAGLWFACFQGRIVRRWSVLPVASFAALSVVSILGYAMPSHGFWRMPALWSLLIICFTAHLLSCFVRRAAPGRPGIQAAILGCALALFFLASYRDLARYPRDLKPRDLEVARFLQEQIANPETRPERIRIDKSLGRHWHVIVVSQHPEEFRMSALDTDIANGNRIEDNQFVVLMRERAESILVPMQDFELLFDNGFWLVARQARH